MPPARFLFRRTRIRARLADKSVESAHFLCHGQRLRSGACTPEGCSRVTTPLRPRQGRDFSFELLNYRRTFDKLALAFGATAAFGNMFAVPSRLAWHERRELFPRRRRLRPPDLNSVLLRDAPIRKPMLRARLNCMWKSPRTPAFERVVATATARVSAAPDWTCRVLAGGLKPTKIYWYRFTDKDGNGSRVGRTRTAPEFRTILGRCRSCRSLPRTLPRALLRMPIAA